MKTMRSTKLKGFTLVELIVTVSIAGILAAVAIPSFISTITNSRLTTSSNELVTALNLARSEAIKRGIQVTVLRGGANGSQWESGWDVFVDFDGDGVLDGDGDATLCEVGEDCLLKTYAALPNGFTLRTGNNYACWVAYTADGLNRGSGASPACSGGLATDTFRLCDSSANTTISRSIVVNNTGRTMVSETTNICP